MTGPPARVQLLRALLEELEKTDRILTNVAALVQRYGSERTERHRMGARAHLRRMAAELEKDLDGMAAGWRKGGS